MARKAADVGLTALNMQLREEYQQEDVFFWANMIGQAKYRSEINKWEIPNSPIVKFNDFASQTHGNELRVEMLRKITGAGKTGKQPLVTKEQEQEFLASTLYVHGKREGIELADWIDELNVDWMDLAAKAYPQLKLWLAKVISTDPTASIFEGAARHITEAAPWGLAKTPMYPRNFWIWDGGNSDFSTNNPGTFSFTSATWRNLIITKLLAGDPADTFGIKTLYSLKQKCKVAQIKPYVIDGKAFYCIVLNSYQERDLLAEGTFPTLVAQAGVRGHKNPLVAAASYMWDGWIIYVNDNVARLPFFVSATTLDFFNYSGGAEQVASGLNPDCPFEIATLHAADQDMACAVILGAGCVGFAESGRPRFTRETRDHESDTAVGIRMKYGMNALNYYDNVTPASATDMAKPQYAVVATHVK